MLQKRANVIRVEAREEDNTIKKDNININQQNYENASFDVGEHYATFVHSV